MPIMTPNAAKKYKDADPEAQAAYAECVAYVLGAETKARKLDCKKTTTGRQKAICDMLQLLTIPIIHLPVEDGTGREAFAQLTTSEKQIIWLDAVNPEEGRVYLG